MSRPAPTYIPVETISAIPITHAWDDDDPYPALGEPDPETVEKLKAVSLKAIYAYSLACAEWVLYRLKNASDDEMPWEYVDAQWARLLDWNFGYVWEPDRDHMDGPVRGPIDVTVRQITNCHNALEQLEGELDAALIARVVEYILPDTRTFHAWQKSALDRLTRLYPRDSEEPYGPAIPREAFDKSVKMTAADGVELVEEYVNSLDFTDNEFLDPDSIDSEGSEDQ